LRRISACLVVLAALAFPLTANAAPIFVNTAASTQAGKCSLKDAIAAANTELQVQGCPPGSGTGDRIEFLLPLPATISAGETMAISSDLEIVGPAAGQLTVTGNHANRVFEVLGSAHVSISNLAIVAGRAESAGGLLVQSPATVELKRVTVSGNEAVSTGILTSAGAILNEGDLVLTEATVTGNAARSLVSSGVAEAAGGGIRNAAGRLLLDRSTVSGNSAIASPLTGTAVAVGGGILDQGELTARDSTVGGNEAAAVSNEPSFASGGGILAATGTGGAPKSTIERTTIAGNSALGTSSSGGGFADAAAGGFAQVTASTIAANTAGSGANVYATGSTAAIRLGSTIVARPSGSQSCQGPTESLGYNLDEGSSCGLGQPTDQTAVDPLLAGGLADNGGPTETIALLHGSPAIDRGLAAVGETADQRGRTRPLDIPGVPNAVGGDGADIGAFEVQVPHATITRGPDDGTSTADPQPIFEFSADAAAAGFLCALDGAAASPCTSPYQTPKLANGRHTLTVAAVGEAGYILTPASRTFTVAVREVEPAVAPHAPRTKLLGLPSKTTKRRLKIRFSSSQAGSTFECKLDKHPWRSCRSPFKTPKLSLGSHDFQVKAIGPTGIADPSPARKRFQVIAPRRR
jgi:hypothetical protein